MKNVKFVILTLVAVFLSVTHLYAFHSPNAIDNKLYTKDTLVLEPLASDNAYQEAKLWFLPDYQENISSNGALKPSTPNNCASFNGDGSGRTYIESPDFNLYNCSGPQSMANKVKCYYGCVCKPAVAFDANSETCTYKCNGVCVGGVSCKPAVSVGAGETCTLKCRGNSSVCVAKACKTAVSVGIGEQCNERCASNSSTCTAKGCKAAVSVGTGESCTQRCASNSNICTGKACNAAVSVGTGESCTQKCASNSNVCTAKACNSAVSVGTGESCTQRCASNSNVCTAKGCASGYTSSGGACVCATSCSHKVTSKPENSYYTTTSCSACGVTSTIQTGWECNSGYNKSGNSCVAACTLPTCTDSVISKPANSYYTTASCTDCSGTKTINTGWKCNSGYSKIGEACQIENCNSYLTYPYVLDSCTRANSYQPGPPVTCGGKTYVPCICANGYVWNGSACTSNETCQSKYGPEFYTKGNCPAGKREVSQACGTIATGETCCQCIEDNPCPSGYYQRNYWTEWGGNNYCPYSFIEHSSVKGCYICGYYSY